MNYLLRSNKVSRTAEVEDGPHINDSDSLLLCELFISVVNHFFGENPGKR
jgi:hypothetical protein